MGIRPLNFPGSQELMRDDDSLLIGRKRKTTTRAILQNPNGQHDIRSIRSTEIPFPDYISYYVKDKLAGKITCMVCGKEDHYTCDCPMKDQEEKVICILCNRAGHCHLWCCRHNVSENHACSRCGEKGHYTNENLSDWGEKYTSLSCSSCDIKHPLGKCPMAEIACFLCEGKDHVPAQCHLSPVLTVITQYHRESFRSAVEQAMAEKSRTVAPDKPPGEIELYDNSRECQFKVNTEMLSGLTHVEQVNCGRESPIKSKVQACKKINTVSKEDRPLTVVSGVVCFNCNYEGHYANQCPKKPQIGESEHYDATCFNCNDKGHYANQCPKKPQLGELEHHDVTCSNFHANRCRKKTPRVLEPCDVTCFNCHDKGHYAKQCPKKPHLGELEQYDVTCSNFHANRCRKKTPRVLELCHVTCFNCNDKGHYANQCPKKL